MLIYRRHENAVSEKFLEIQEHSAAMAEEDARAAAGLGPTPAPLFEAYVRMRVFRRQLSGPNAACSLSAALRDLFLAFKMWSPRLAVAIGTNLARYARIAARRVLAGQRSALSRLPDTPGRK